MPNLPLVSVLMPVLAPEPRLFREAINSITRQQFADWELIIVEDPSRRTGRGIVDSFQDKRIRYFCNSARTSLCQQRNRTLELARGEYVAMLDADDIARPDRLLKQVRFLENNPDISVVGSWIEAIDTRGKSIGYREYPTSCEAIRTAMRRFNPIAQPAVMARRDPLLRIGGYQYDRFPFSEDYDLWCRLAKEGHSLANMPEFLIQYRIHPQGSKSSSLRQVLRGTIDIKLTHWRTEMQWWDWTRLWGERGLLLLPTPLVLALFTSTHYRN